MPVACRLIAHSFSPTDVPVNLYGTTKLLQPGEVTTLEWQVSGTEGAPIAGVGVTVTADADATVYLDWLGWDGAPDVRLGRGAGGSMQWRRAWVKAVDRWDPRWSESFRLSHDDGRGLLIQGTREWADYAVSVDLTPHVVKAAGLAVRVQGLRRYYALLLRNDDAATLVKVLDGEKQLGRTSLHWQEKERHKLRLWADGAHIRAFVDDQMLFDVEDADRPLLTGAIALVCEEGTVSAGAVTVSPL
jgi:hypothetical protein